VDQNEFTYSPGIYTAAYNCLVDRYQCYVGLRDMHKAGASRDWCAWLGR